MAQAAAAVVDLVRIYGMVKPTVTYSSAAVESYGNPNASAITAAGNPVLSNSPDESRLSFQVAQSRFGIWVGEKTNYRAHLEFDFVDFGRASPTVQSLLRLRVATFEWSVTDRLVLSAGQDWDLDAPINPYGINMVGAQFLAGNHGFMRQQVKAVYTLGKRLELGGAVGLQNANATAKDSTVELGRMPSFALRATALLGSMGRVGMSGIVTRLRFSPGPDERYALAGAGTVFGDVTPYETLNVRFEGYIGRNVANIGVALGTGSRAKDVEEAGFFVSARQLLTEKHALFGTFSHARALDPDEVSPSYSYPSSTPAPDFSTATSAGTGTGFRWNQSARFGYAYKPAKPVILALEGFWYNTHHQLLDEDASRITGRRHALGVDVTSVYTF